MKPLLITLGASLLLASSCSRLNTTDLSTSSTPKAVYVILDGISADVLERVDTPFLDEIASEGGYARATTGGTAGGYSQSVTASAIGYANVLTGTWANKHNVYDNSISDPKYAYWSLFRLAESVRPELKTAIYSSWTDNRTKLIGAGLEQSGGFAIDIVRDGYDLDTLAFPQDSGWVRKVDDKVAEEAAASLLADGPDLSWVYLWYPDETGHIYGDGELYDESIRHADAQVGRIWNAIKERRNRYDEEWLIIVTTDHGRRLPDGRDHGGQTARERTVWFVTNASDLNARFQTMESPTSPTSDRAVGESDAAMYYELNHVDVYPTIARHLGLEMPEHVANEIDGVPFSGPVSVSGVRAERLSDGRINVRWTPWLVGVSDHADFASNDIPADSVDILMSSTNSAREGGVDMYSLAARAALADSMAVLPVQVQVAGTDTIKVLVKGRYQGANAWLVPAVGNP